MIRELQWGALQGNGLLSKFESLRITPLLPGCCQSLPARISHGPSAILRAFDARSAACSHRQGDS
jgi:hypothetical protein